MYLLTENQFFNTYKILKLIIFLGSQIGIVQWLKRPSKVHCFS
jgi:hypothetical protein